MERLRRDFPAFAWTPRIRFAGLLDVPDEHGETRAQGPVGGLAVDLFSGASPEPGILDLKPALVSGALPRKRGRSCWPTSLPPGWASPPAPPPR